MTFIIANIKRDIYVQLSKVYRFLNAYELNVQRIGIGRCRLQGFWSLKIFARIISVIFIIFVLKSLYSFDPFGLASVSSFHSKTLFYQWTTGLYKGRNSNPVSVVILRDESFHGSWPVKAIVHAEILDAILEWEPRAVFVDFAFIDRRNDASLQSELIPVINNYIAAKKENQNSPGLFFLSITPDTELPQGILPELAETGVSLVSGPAENKQFPGLEYIANPKPDWPAEIDVVIQPAAAFAIYRDLFPESLSTLEDLELVWRTYSKPGNNGPYYCTEQCDSVALRITRQFVEYAPEVFSFLVEYLTEQYPCLKGARRQQCPPIPSIDAYFLLNGLPESLNENPLEELIKGKIVFYGGDLDAMNDFVYPPTHSSIPGVYFNAMAMDNLLVYGDDYLRHDSSLVKGRLELFGLIVLTLLTEFTWFLLYGVGKNRDGGLDKMLEKQTSLFRICLIDLGIVLCYLLSSFVFIAMLTYIGFFKLHTPPIDFLGLISLIGVRMLPSVIRIFDQIKNSLHARLSKPLKD